MPGVCWVIAVALGYEGFALARDKETLSEGFWRLRDSGYGFVAYVGWGALTWHFLMDRRRRKWRSS